MQGIYAITHVATGRRYIGSSVNIAARWSAHRKALEYGTHANQRLQRVWQKYGSVAFSFEVVEPVDERGQLLEREQAHIDATRDAYNMGRAGQAMRGRTHSPEAIERMRARRRQRPPVPQEVRDRIAASLRGRKATSATRALLSAQRAGRPGRPIPADVRAKISAALTGRPSTPEAIAKRSAALKGRVVSAEQRAKVSAALMGHSVSQEARERMSLAAKNRAIKAA